MAPHDAYDDEDDAKEAGSSGVASKFKEFDCPSCNANNPVDPPFGNGEEVLCNYCGEEFSVKVSDEGRVKLREA
ncbi:MAG: hypothetical protein M3Y59_01990 [Myxococcota bacterium]|nr:hypothetical protein [Myxococcota bacterium]